MTAAIEPTAAAVVRAEPDMGGMSVFASESNFDAAQRMAKALAASTIVPAAYIGNVANCLIALEMASRTGAGALAVMQNLHVIDGKPGWASSFLIASVNSCGRFTPIRYEFVGTEGQDDWKCRAYATEKETGDRLDGTWITWKMVKGEGWLGRKGSKWQTMPEQMMRYRSAAFWVRAYAPEISIGMHTAEEIGDFTESQPRTVSLATATLNQALEEAEDVRAEIEIEA